MTMTFVSTSVVGSGGATSITFSSIPQTGKDLLLLISARSSFSGFDEITVQLNGHSGFNYSTRYMRSNGGGVAGGPYQNQSSFFIGKAPGTSATANTFSNSRIYFLNYTNSTNNKSLTANSTAGTNGSSAWVEMAGGRLAQTTAISSITLDTSNGGSFLENTSISLYIIT